LTAAAALTAARARPIVAVKPAQTAAWMLRPRSASSQGTTQGTFRPAIVLSYLLGMITASRKSAAIALDRGLIREHSAEVERDGRLWSVVRPGLAGHAVRCGAGESVMASASSPSGKGTPRLLLRRVLVLWPSHNILGRIRFPCAQRCCAGWRPLGRSGSARRKSGANTRRLSVRLAFWSTADHCLGPCPVLCSLYECSANNVLELVPQAPASISFSLRRPALTSEPRRHERS
jgi:hypothetical protein